MIAEVQILQANTCLVAAPAVAAWVVETHRIDHWVEQADTVCAGSFAVWGA